MNSTMSNSMQSKSLFKNKVTPLKFVGRSSHGSPSHIRTSAAHPATPAVMRNKLHGNGRLLTCQSACGGQQAITIAPTSASLTAPAPGRPPPVTPESDLPPVESSSILACVLLIMGATVGVGMLALPTVTAPAGFVASSSALLVGCGYSLITGLLIAEVTINFTAQQPASNTTVSLTSMAISLLGKRGTPFVVGPYLFLHYACLVAYISKSAVLVSALLGLPLIASSALFTAVLGGACYVLPHEKVDALNGTLVAVMVAAFLGLLGVAAGGVEVDSLVGNTHWDAVLPTLPTIALAFVFQNVVPVVVNRLGSNPKKVGASIIWGSIAALSMFILWDGAIMGTPLPESMAGMDPIAAMQASSPVAGPLISGFTFFAVSSSFISFALALTDFIGDALQSQSSPEGDVAPQLAFRQLDSIGQADAFQLGPAAKKQPTAAPETELVVASDVAPMGPDRAVLYGLALAPPFLFSQLNPSAFYAALDYAGTYGVMSLFGILPAAMAWQQRYGEAGGGARGGGVEMVPGGKPVLIGLGGAAVWLICNQAVGHLTQMYDTFS